MMGSMLFGILLGCLPHSKWEYSLRPCRYEDISFAPLGCSGRYGFIRCPHECPSQVLKVRILLKIAVVALSGLLVSCTFSEYPIGKVIPYGGVSSLPSGYSGNAYYWNGSYYTGGRYERGRFHYIDRFYKGRYMFNEKYLYGGSYQYIQGVSQYPDSGVYSNRRCRQKHRYYPPFHHHQAY
jgi:hypothetical protein